MKIAIFGAGAIGGVLFFLGAALQQMGLVTATVTNTGFLTALYVVVTPLLVWLFEGRAPGLLVWIAVGAIAPAGYSYVLSRRPHSPERALTRGPRPSDPP